MTIIKIVNFGPIREGEIELGDLTVFAGYPNTGKSYTAKIIYSLNFISELIPTMYFPEKEFIDELYRSLNKRVVIEYLNRIANEIKNDVKSNIGDVKKKFKFVISTKDYEQILIKIIEIVLKRAFGAVFGDYGIDLLAGSKIKVYNNGKYILIIDKGMIKEFKYGPEGFVEELNVQYRSGLVHFVELNEIYSYNDIAKFTVEEISAIMFKYILYKIVKKLMEKIIGKKWYYIPYGRSQIVQLLSSLLHTLRIEDQRFLQKLILSYMSRWFLEPTIIPSKYIEYFINGTLYYNKKDKSLGHLVKELIELVINGKIRVEVDKTTNIPTYYKYVFNNEIIDIYNASAFVSEVSGILIPLHIIMPGENIIIEEPEAQLHPHFQRIIAWLLTYISSLGSQILITTHSDYLLTELGIISIIAKEGLIDKGTKILEELLDINNKRAFDIIKEISSTKPNIKVYIFKEGLIKRIKVEKLIEEIPTSIETLSQQLQHITLVSPEK